ncbi:hypothetical protein HDE_09695 [Halotydeus destructor]|nr:hypothetical protein HDE_09695 [Halotydeus destructor]
MVIPSNPCSRLLSPGHGSKSRAKPRHRRLSLILIHLPRTMMMKALFAMTALCWPPIRDLYRLMPRLSETWDGRTIHITNQR